MSVRILTGHVLDRLKDLDDESVQCVVTSPPYYGLRAYGTESQTWPDGWVGELGQEPTVDLYVAHLVAVFAAVRRVLRSDGVLFVNLGDSYANDAKWGGNTGGKHAAGMHGNHQEGYRQRRRTGLKPKDLMLVPDRFRLAMQADGWWVRSKMPWVKRNCLSGGTRVYVRSQKGDMPMTIKDLARLDPETVQLWTGEKWTQVVGIWESERPDDLIEARLRSGEHIGCTDDHRWPTQRGIVAASDLVVGDVIQTTTLPQPNEPRMPTGLPDADIGWLVGLYIAEGCRDANAAIHIAGHTQEVARFTRLCAIAEAYDGTCRRHNVGGNSTPIYLSGPILNGILDAYVSGEGSHRKHLTTRAWQRSNAFLRGVLDGYLSGDGHWDERNRRWRLGFCENDPLTEDIRTLCGRLGVGLRLNRCQHQIDGRKIPGWRGQIRFDRGDRTPPGGFRLAGDGEVVEIGKSNARKVWDLTVADEPHLFALASGVLTHNCMPGAVGDRPVTAVEEVMLFTRSPRYFWDAEAVKRANSSPEQLAHNLKYAKPYAKYDDRAGETGQPGNVNNVGIHGRPGTNGRNFRSSDLFFDSLGLILDESGDPLALDVNPAPFKDAHFATFPPKLVRPLILAGTSEKACADCGAPYVRLVEKSVAFGSGSGRAGNPPNGKNAGRPQTVSGDYDVRMGPQTTTRTTGRSPSCQCPTTDTKPCLVLDCFGGSGTTGLVADQLGRDAVLIDLNPSYISMGADRISGDAPLFAAVEVER